MSAPAPRPYHHGNLRSTLLAHAERTLDDGGVAQLSLRDLARRAGVSHAAPRRHFTDKQALLDALAEDGFERLGTDLRAAMDAAGGGFDARLLAFAHGYVRFATRHAPLLELMFAGKERPDASVHVREAADRAFEAPLALIGEAQLAGAVIGGDPVRVAMVTWALLQGLAAMHNSGMLDGATLDDVVAEAVECLVHGLRPR